jgi:hypothetical protein
MESIFSKSAPPLQPKQYTLGDAHQFQTILKIPFGLIKMLRLLIRRIIRYVIRHPASKAMVAVVLAAIIVFIGRDFLKLCYEKWLAWKRQGRWSAVKNEKQSKRKRSNSTSSSPRRKSPFSLIMRRKAEDTL